MNPPDNVIYQVNLVYPLTIIRIEDISNQTRIQLVGDLVSFGYSSTIGDYTIQSYTNGSTYVRIFSKKMLQDKRVREVLLEYLV